MATGLRSSIRLFFLFSGAVVAMPAACLYPSYTFEEPEPGAGGASASTTSSAGGATSTTTTTATTTSSAGGGGAGPSSESACLDGIDNDSDGDVDCADSDCTPDYECVDPLPSGWGALGYLELFRGDPADAPPCPDDKPSTAYTGHGGLKFTAATCSSCSCGSPVGQTCRLTADLDADKAGLQPFQVKNAPCGVPATSLSSLTVPDVWGGVCFHSDGLAGGQTCADLSCNKSVTSAPASVSGGSCNATGGTKTASPPTWDLQGKACKGTASGGGCDGGKTCQPRPTAPFESGLCVSKAGEVDCPEGLFQQQYFFYDDYVDSRSCTSCDCNDPTGGSCELTVRLFSDPGVNMCSDEVAKLTTGTCFDLSNNPAIYGWTSAVLSAPSGGACTSTGPSQPGGTVTGHSATTFCCVP